MRAIEYTNKVSTNILHLLYSTCTNDLVIHSKQASIIEDFLFAFCIEFNRLFIADSFLMTVIKTKVISKVKKNYNDSKSLYKNNWVESKDAVLEFVKAENWFAVLKKIAFFDNSNIESYSLSKLFNTLFSNTKETLLLIPIYKNKR